MRVLIAATLLTATSVMANDCHVKFDGHMSLQQNRLQVTLDKGNQLVLDGQNVWLDNQPLTLGYDQQHLLNSYHQQVRGLVPKIADIVIEAVDLANQGVSRAFGELLGKDDEGVLELSQELSQLSMDLRSKFYGPDGNPVFDSVTFEDGQFLDTEFESRLEEKIEKLVANSMGKLMIAIGTEMLFSGGDMQAFERRMEDFGDQLEQEMEIKADIIEAKATALCSDMLELDRLENEIRRDIPELASMDMLQVSDYQQAM
ncbi:DUF2884 family protein [Aliiglaciecola sp. CAU 1673]|uniref:DUF2884 family protein n=1 Tax=Aliiglaciecola sp. CAU 1673 TaxID=3032595 RepID=UPI0023DA7368|nr:DUF2884 family protein [Aliiglaciecola sp. CAU 1673]MDF2177776.1 DUF2884 family protein [Aliiglaciecola sp. CAU 1673]